MLPILLWRAIFSLAHLTTYWPYLVPLLLAHVVVVHLVWRRCLLEGADVWVASGLALLFALYGTGAEDLAWAFQIGFVGSVGLGLLAVELADGVEQRGGLAVLRPLGSGSLASKPLARDCIVAVVVLAALPCAQTSESPSRSPWLL